MGYVRRRDQIANEKIAAAAGRTMREVIPTAFVAVRTMCAKTQDDFVKTQERL